MDTQCLPTPADSKFTGPVTGLLPVTDMNLQIDNLDVDEDLNWYESACTRFRESVIIGIKNDQLNTVKSHSRDSLASSNGNVKALENGYASHTPEDENKIKKRVNICTDELPGETTALRRPSETSDSVADKSVTSISMDKCLTMTGTIKRGKKAGQNLDVRLNISREELEVLEANIAAKENQSWALCGFTKGPHIFLWTILCFPVATIISSIYSFYIGTLMWYNIFSYVTEEKNVFYRILLTPFLILLYPFIILMFTFGLGFYAGIIQISWCLDSWSKEITDWEKGFYGWFCSNIGLEDCSPYEVVVLTDIQVTATNQEQPSKDDSQNSIPEIAGNS